MTVTPSCTAGIFAVGAGCVGRSIAEHGRTIVERLRYDIAAESRESVFELSGIGRLVSPVHVEPVHVGPVKLVP